MEASKSSPGPYHASQPHSNRNAHRMGFAWVALGSNLGHRQANLERALTWLDALPETRLLAVSPFLVTAPVGPPQPDYLNAVVRLQTALGPLDLLDALLVLERAAGRVRGAGEVRWGPRTLDLDLLFAATHLGRGGQTVLTHPRLELPHPRVHERAFVLRPLVLIDPEIVHPTTGRTVGDHLAAIHEQPVREALWA